MSDSAQAQGRKQVGNGNGTRIFGIITLVAAIGAGAGAFLMPMNQRIDSLQAEIMVLRQDLRDHAASDGHPAVSTKIATMHEKFVEIETQFKGERRVLGLYQEGDLRHQLQTDERFRELEKTLLWKDGVK